MKLTKAALSYDANGNLKHELPSTLNRRDVLGSLAIITAALALPYSRSLSTFSDRDISNLAIRVASVLGFKDTFDFAHLGNESSIAALLSDILTLSVDERTAVTLSDAQLRDRISAQTALDYSRNDMVNLEGWWIAITEARCLRLVGAVADLPA